MDDKLPIMTFSTTNESQGSAEFFQPGGEGIAGILGERAVDADCVGDYEAVVAGEAG